MEKLIDHYFEEMNIDGISQMLEGINEGGTYSPKYKEAYMCIDTDRYAKKLVKLFKAKYKKDLKFRQINGSGLYYFSYVETELSDVYDRTDLFKISL